MLKEKFSISSSTFLIVLCSIFINTNLFALDANVNGQWISFGEPSYIHQGTRGDFYLNGTNEGKCAGVKPTYFRVDMSAPYFKEFYSFILYMSSKKQTMECIVKSGCGNSQVWIEYCRGSIK